LFTNTKRDCSVPKLAEFYASCAVTSGIVTSSVNGRELCFDAYNLGDWFGVPSKGFDEYVCEDKSILGDERLLEFTRKLV